MTRNSIFPQDPAREAWAAGERARVRARMRPPLRKWDLRFLLLAKTASSFSKDPSTKVGAALSRSDNTLAGLGFNGLAPGVDDARIVDREFKLAAVIHAEENALLSARDSTLRDSALYVWGLAPCAHCVAVALRRGVRKIIAMQLVDRPEWAASCMRAEHQCLDAGVALTVLRPGDAPELVALELPAFARGAR